MSGLRRAARAAQHASPLAVSLPRDLPTSSTSTRSSGREGSPLLNRRSRKEPPEVVGAEGIYHILKDGRKILDASCGASVTSFGPESRNDFEDAIVQQRKKFVPYACALSYSTGIAKDFANALLDTTDGHMRKATLYGAGSAAVEAAEKLALQYFREIEQESRTLFIARKQSYHGTTFATLSLGHHEARREPFKDVLMTNVSHVSPCAPYRGKNGNETDAAYVARLKDELERRFQALGPENVAAFIAEPIVGAALGCVPALPGYLAAMKEVCDKHGALLILDEIMCGMGRCGQLHAWQGEGIVPDIQCLGKGLSGGYEELSAVLMSKKIAEAIHDGSGYFNHGHTFQNSPTGCAAGLQVLKVIEDEQLLLNVRTKGDLLMTRLQKRLDNHINVGDIRGKGLFIGIEFVHNKATKAAFKSKDHIAMRLHDMGLEDPFNIFLYPGTGSADGMDGDHLIVSPPFNITEEDVDEIVKRTGDLIEHFFATL